MGKGELFQADLEYGSHDASDHSIEKGIGLNVKVDGPMVRPTKTWGIRPLEIIQRIKIIACCPTKTRGSIRRLIHRMISIRAGIDGTVVGAGAVDCKNATNG